MDDRALTSAEQACTRGRRAWRTRHTRPAKRSERGRSRSLRATLVATIVPVMLAATIVFPAAAQANLTQGFRVHDFSRYPLKLVDVKGGPFESRPATGSILRPGAGAQGFELIYHFLEATEATAYYARVAGDGQALPGTVFAAQMHVTGLNSPRSRCFMSGGLYACAPSPYWRIDEKTLTFEDQPGTVIDVAAGKGQEQASVLKQFCAESNRATCTFTVRKREDIYSTQDQVGQALVNETSATQDLSTKVEDSVGSSDSLGGELKVGGEIAKIVSVELTARYEHQWTQQHTFGQEVSIHCPGATQVLDRGHRADVP